MLGSSWEAGWQVGATGKPVHVVYLLCPCRSSSHPIHPPAPNTLAHNPATAAAARYEQQHGRFPAAADAHALRDAWAAEAAAAGVPADALPGEQLDAYSAAPGDMPAINAVVGGVLANELIKALGGKGEPINNFFLFSLAEGSGMVERMGAAST